MQLCTWLAANECPGNKITSMPKSFMSEMSVFHGSTIVVISQCVDRYAYATGACNIKIKMWGAQQTAVGFLAIHASRKWLRKGKRSAGFQ